MKIMFYDHKDINDIVSYGNNLDIECTCETFDLLLNF